MKSLYKLIFTLILSVIIVINAMPVMASSVGSVSSDTSIGIDSVQNAVTEYSEVGEGNTDTEVYLTIDNNNVRVGVPTALIMNGKPNENGEYIAEYSVNVSGDIAGKDTLIVKPTADSVSLIQTGKTNSTAVINQDKTIFTCDDLKNNASTNGSVIAQSLTAGTWNGQTSFNIKLINYNSTACIEYFTWGEDEDFLSAYNSGDLSDYSDMTVSEESTFSTYAYPERTALTGLTEEGLDWIQNNGGNLILPSCASSISDSTKTSSAFGRFNSVNGWDMSDAIEYIYIPSNIKTVGEYAFSGLENLVYADVYSKNIKKGSFVNCTRLKTVDFHNNAVDIGRSAFMLCINLTNVKGADNIISIDYQGFANCYKLNNIDSLNNCITIGERAFVMTYELQNLNLNPNIQSIGQAAFELSNYIEDFSNYDSCSFGKYATINQIYPNGIPKYTYTPCKNEIYHFAQHDSRWSQIKIPGTQKYFGSSGCGWCCLATIYNYYNNTNLNPVEIVNMVYDVNPSLIYDGSFHYADTNLYKAVGLTSEGVIGGNMNTSDIGKLSDLQTLMDALAEGKLAIINYAQSVGGSAHSVVAYGVTEDGKLMVADGSLSIHLSSDPDYTSTDDIRLQEPYYYTVKPEAMISSWNNYCIISNGQ